MGIWNLETFKIRTLWGLFRWPKKVTKLDCVRWLNSIAETCKMKELARIVNHNLSANKRAMMLQFKVIFLALSSFWLSRFRLCRNILALWLNHHFGLLVWALWTSFFKIWTIKKPDKEWPINICTCTDFRSPLYTYQSISSALLSCQTNFSVLAA